MSERDYYLKILKKLEKDFTIIVKDCIGVLSTETIAEYENKRRALSFAIKAVNENEALKAEIREYRESWRPKIRDNY